VKIARTARETVSRSHDRALFSFLRIRDALSSAKGKGEGVRDQWLEAQSPNFTTGKSGRAQ